MKISSASLLVASVAPALAIPPEDFGFPSAPNDTQLTVSFSGNGNNSVVKPGELFGAGITANQPTIAVNTGGYDSLASYNGSYFVLMVDPDASYPDSPNSRFYLHWAAQDLVRTQSAPAALGITGFQLTNSTPSDVEWTQPSPPTNSSAHRYIVYAFEQPSNFSAPSSFTGFSSENRAKFSLTDFISQTNLGTPAAANYFYVSNQTKVPSNFVASPGGQYPGGNGAMVTSGSGNGTTNGTATATSTVVSTTTGGSSPSGSAGSGGSSPTTTGGSGGSSATGSGSSSSKSGAAALPTAAGGMLGAGMLGLVALVL